MTSGSALYEIRVRGHLGQTMRTAFPELRVRVEGGDTVLSGAPSAVPGRPGRSR
jgi:hypothetical protein